MLRNIFWKNPLIRIITICSFVTGMANYLCTDFVTVPREEKRRAQEVEVIKRTNRAAAVAEYERRQALKNATVVFETETGDKIETETVEGPEILYDAPGPPKNYWGILYGWTAEQIRDADDIPEEIKHWLIRRKVLDERETAYYEKSRANTVASLAASEDESALMLKTWALLSPEQLKFARREALKTYSAEDVDDFFDELDRYINTTTPERIHRNYQKLLNPHEAYKIVKRELAIEKRVLIIVKRELAIEKEVLIADAHHHHDESPCGYDLRAVARRAEQINAAEANRESIRARGYMSAISTDMTVGMVANGILGAGIGAAIGSIAPGMGTAAGAITGFAIGVLNGGVGGGVGGAKRHRDARREADAAVARAQKRLDAAREELHLCIRSEATPKHTPLSTRQRILSDDY